MREDLARYWRALERVYAQLPNDGRPFVIFLCQAVWEAWREVESFDAFAYVDVYLRDRFRCACPVCLRRDVTAHHIVFRSHGGGEARTNLTALCTECHLEGVHRSRLHVEGKAPSRLRWALLEGRMQVVGRTKSTVQFAARSARSAAASAGPSMAASASASLP